MVIYFVFFMSINKIIDEIEIIVEFKYVDRIL